MPRLSNTSRVRIAALAAILAAAGAAASAIYPRGGPSPAPESAALVRDDAGLLAEGERTRLAEFHAFLLDDHDIDYRVDIVDAVGDLNRYAVERFEELRVGAASTSARGLLLVIDPRADLVRLEVGRALAGSFPDAFVAYVEHRQMVPFFRSGRVGDGILATTELIVQRVQEEKRTGGYQDHLPAPGTAGGGAATAARIGAGAEAETGSGEAKPAGQAMAPADSPRSVVAAYLAAMHARNADPDLSIYTQATRDMLRGWTTTPAQMDNIARVYRRCEPESIRTRGSMAVVRYAISDRACAPFFLRQEAGQWRLDLTMMQSAIRFGRNNAWRLVPGADHPYGFAFVDWRFDGNGFPIGER
jgi:uncharacterized protein